MIVSGRFTVTAPPRAVHGSIYGIRGDIIVSRVDATVVSRKTHVASNAPSSEASGVFRVVGR